MPIANFTLFCGIRKLLRQRTIFNAEAVASPPPMPSDATPLDSPLFCRAAISVATIRDPDEPMGCPSAQAPPFTFTFKVLLKFSQHKRQCFGNVLGDEARTERPARFAM